MHRFINDVGVLVPNVLLPKAGSDFFKWAVVACDQYTSQPEYWENAERIAGGAPTALHLILPEAYLGKAGEAERIEGIKASMREYLEQGALEAAGEGFVLVERTVAGNTRHGLVLALDLERYDYHRGAKTLIRATEGTIEERIPPRLRIREGAALELPHILVLIDDPDKTVIEPLSERADALPRLYDTDLMLDGGHITGRLVAGEADINGVLNALAALTDKAAFNKKYGVDEPLLFAMGDGNHSFATAKAYWEKIKKDLPEGGRADHPARFALVEIENVHDDGIVFEPIHRVLFGVDAPEAMRRLGSILGERNAHCEWRMGAGAAAGGETHVLPVLAQQVQGAFVVSGPAQQLAVGTLQNAIDALLAETPGAFVDYIHGADVVETLSKKDGTIGFLLPKMEKSELFPTVVFDGALPRKTFSMGEANEKRYYMECRKIER